MISCLIRSNWSCHGRADSEEQRMTNLLDLHQMSEGAEEKAA